MTDKRTDQLIGIFFKKSAIIEIPKYKNIKQKTEIFVLNFQSLNILSSMMIVRHLFLNNYNHANVQILKMNNDFAVSSQITYEWQLNTFIIQSH